MSEILYEFFDIQMAKYKTEPFDIIDGIPIFTISDTYIENYKKIAADHLASANAGVDNPFIGNELWQRLDSSTRVLIEKYTTFHQRILDIGVGLGRVLEPLNHLERYGVDISLDYLKIAQSKGLNVAFARVEDLPYEDNSFDALVTCDVLEHVLDLNLATKEMLRVLKPGGTLIIRVPYKEDLEPYLNPDLPYEFIHLRNFDVASLRLHFEKIFKLKFLESSIAEHELQGHPRFSLRLFPNQSGLNEILSAIHDMNHPLWLLKCATLVKADDFMNWMYDLRDNKRAYYDQIAPYLVFGIDVNVVFTKPLDVQV